MVLLTLLLACGSSPMPEVPEPAPAVATEAAAAPAPALAAKTPLVFAHRGASGYRPDHTLAAYTLAVEQGADHVEPDLVMTKDGHLVARHDLELGPTTDVAEVHPDRRTTRTVEGREASDWFADTFTLAEVGQLRARQPRDDRSKAFDGQHGVPTWPAILEWAAAQPRPIGLVPELKHPTHLRARGLDPVPPFLAALESSGFPHDRVWVQCFEMDPLRELRAATDLKLVQLIGAPEDHPADGGPSYADLLMPEGLAEIATYAHAIGVHKQHLLPLAEDGTYAEPTSVLADAHAAGLQVHVYTFRDDPGERPAADATPADELRRFYALGVDAVFADHPDTAVGAR